VSIFGDVVEIVGYEDLKSGLDALSAKSAYPVVSLDRAYVDDATSNVSMFVDLTRWVDQDLNDLGLHGRDGHPYARSQNSNPLFHNGIGDRPIVLADDVIFSGENLAQDIDYLRQLRNPVMRVIAGIGVREGVAKIEATGVPVTCVRRYSNVIDEVCERDFYAGVPLSGRTVQDTRQPARASWSAPYFEPFGRPDAWASIPPERAAEFSRFCLLQSIKLWEAVEQASGKPIYVETPRADALSLRRLPEQGEGTPLLTVLKATLAEPRGEG